MLPLTPKDKETRSKFQQFLFKGFMNKDELHAAVLANNPDMTQEQRAIMEKDLEQLNEIIDDASFDRSIVCGMVEVVDV